MLAIACGLKAADFVILRVVSINTIKINKEGIIMGPTENNNQGAAGVPGAGAPADGGAVTPPAGVGADPAASSSWPQPPAVDPATLAEPAAEGNAEVQAAMPAAAADAAEPNPEDVSMGDEAPAEPEAPAPPAAAPGSAAPSDPSAGAPTDAAPQQ